MMRASLFIATAALLLPACPGSSDSDPDADVLGSPDAETIDGDVDPPDECTADGDCVIDAEASQCSVARCTEGRCTMEPRPDETSCDDGDACTQGDRCLAGRCTASSGGCDDGNACTTDGCDPQNGCVYTFNQLPCDDGSACTSGDRCFQGSCSGTALNCDDGEQCTDDDCDPTLGCTNVDRVGSCEDGDACTTGDSCIGGQCVSGASTPCGEPGNPCQTGTCDPVTGCEVTFVSGACDDNDACTDNDECSAGVCVGSLVVCDDGNACTDDYCDQTLGCQTLDNVLSCDDGDPCTVGDQCGDGVCVSGETNPLCCGEMSDCNDDDPCTTDSCEAGMCVFTPLDCDDGAACTADRCTDGVCHNDPFGPLDGALVADGFEQPSGLESWTAESDNPDVYWQLDDSQAFEGGSSLYCGNIQPDGTHSYDFGQTLASVSRTLTVPPGTPTLSFHFMADLAENTSCTYDVLRVLIDGEALEPLCSSLENWTEQTYDLTKWAESSVVLRFEFDTFDGQSNAGQGLWIDGLQVTTVSDLICCEDPDQCPQDEANACAVPICEAHQCGFDTGGCPQ